MGLRCWRPSQHRPTHQHAGCNPLLPKDLKCWWFTNTRPQINTTDRNPLPLTELRCWRHTDFIKTAVCLCVSVVNTKAHRFFFARELESIREFSPQKRTLLKNASKSGQK